MTVRELRDELVNRLSTTIDVGEARAMANVMIEDVKGYTPTQLVMYGDRTVLDETVDRMMRMVDRVIDGEPLQYVIGTARFRGRDFKVTPAVLIPRPETGQLVDMIVDTYGCQQDLQVLDLGCGSGCIAISLALDLPFAEVTAVDISKEALAVTEQNATRLKAVVKATLGDIYSYRPDGEYDIIVSNPPYILESERESLDSRVKDYEPAQALFVPDSDPIGIYQAIADIAEHSLAKDGTLYLEINPLCAASIKQMLMNRWHDVRIERDYRGNERFAIARL